jgi:hypothetical protein
MSLLQFESCIYIYILLDTSVYVQNMALVCLFVKIMFVSPLQFHHTLLLPRRHCKTCSLHSSFLETVCVCVFCVCVCLFCKTQLTVAHFDDCVVSNDDVYTIFYYKKQILCCTWGIYLN